MAKLTIFLLLLCVLSFTSSAFDKQYTPQSYIESSCRKTLYPSLCVRCLSHYASKNKLQNPQDLARIALRVSLYRAEVTKAYMLKVAERLKTVKAKEYPAVNDCLMQINDSVEQLTLSIKELQRVEKEQMSDHLGWHISNIETWTSTAMTDACTCMDAFQGRRMSKLKATIKGKVKNVAEVTSNALALFHHYAALRYRARAAAKKP